MDIVPSNIIKKNKIVTYRNFFKVHLIITLKVSHCYLGTTKYN